MCKKTYAVWWQEPDGLRHAGKLELDSGEFALSGNGLGRTVVPLDEIVSVDYRRGELHIERRGGLDLLVGNLDGLGALFELSEALAA